MFWIQSGCVAIKGAILESATAKLDGDDIILRDSGCNDDQPQLCKRGISCCKRCAAAADRTKFLTALQDWALKIRYVDMAHVTLGGNKEEQQKLAQEILELWPHTQEENLGEITYSAMVSKCRLAWMRVPICKQNDAMKVFLSRSLKYLTPMVLAGIGPEIKEQITSYIDCLSRGDLDPHETKAIES